MNELFKQMTDPQIDPKGLQDAVANGSIFNANCGSREALSIAQFKRRLEDAEADRQETAGAANRTDNAGIKMENFSTQNTAYDAGYINFGKGMGF